MTRKHITLPRLMIVSSGGEHLSYQGLVSRQAEAISQSAPVIFQLREKGLDAGMFLELSLKIAPVIGASGSLFVVNERFDIAIESNACGVHLPESSCPADTVRKAAPGLLTGQSVHGKTAALAASRAGLDYLLFGPVFPTPSKEPFGPPQGLERLGDICRAVSVPVFAIGGITLERALACIEQGAYGIAALAPFLDSVAIPETINNFLSFLPS
jgi:thiamine-phosphate pyrophosphorylase